MGVIPRPPRRPAYCLRTASGYHPTMPKTDSGEDFIRIADIARYLGVNKQRAHQLAGTRGFPRPAKRLRSGRLWEPFAIDEWAKREWWASRPWRERPSAR